MYSKLKLNFSDGSCKLHEQKKPGAIESLHSEVEVMF